MRNCVRKTLKNGSQAKLLFGDIDYTCVWRSRLENSYAGMASDEDFFYNAESKTKRIGNFKTHMV